MCQTFCLLWCFLFSTLLSCSWGTNSVGAVLAHSVLDSCVEFHQMLHLRCRIEFYSLWFVSLHVHSNKANSVVVVFVDKVVSPDAHISPTVWNLRKPATEFVESRWRSLASSYVYICVWYFITLKQDISLANVLGFWASRGSGVMKRNHAQYIQRTRIRLEFSSEQCEFVVQLKLIVSLNENLCMTHTVIVSGVACYSRLFAYYREVCHSRLVLWMISTEDIGTLMRMLLRDIIYIHLTIDFFFLESVQNQWMTCTRSSAQQIPGSWSMANNVVIITRLLCISRQWYFSAWYTEEVIGTLSMILYH